MDEKRPLKSCNHSKQIFSTSPDCIFSCVTHNLEEYLCVKCDYMTHFKILLKKKHTSSEFEDIFRNLTCSKCRSFTTCSILVLTKHESQCTNEISNEKITKLKACITPIRGSYQCDLCSFKTAYLEVIEKHKHMHDSIRTAKWFSCDICFYKTDKVSLKNHIKQHKGKELDVIKWLQCPLCVFKTNKTQYLEEHVQLRHQSVYDMKCAWCSFTTIYKSNLTAHVLRKHVRNEFYQCSSCPFRTKYAKSLKNHNISLHTEDGNIKWLKCKQCGFKGKTKSVLWKHKMAAHRKAYEDEGGKIGDRERIRKLIIRDHCYAMQKS